MMNKMREDWIEVELGEICVKITDGTHHTPTYVSDGIHFISVKDIYNGIVNFENTKYISEKEHEELIKRCNPEPDDLLITKSGTIGRMALVPHKPPFSLFVSVALIKNIKEVIGSKFLMFSLEDYIKSISISQVIKGGLLKNFHLEDIRKTIIKLAPLPIQRAIVSKIEALFSDLDNGIANFKKAQEQLKIYRQAVLKKAFEGGFSITNEELRITNEENHSSGNLPKGWKWVKLGEVGKVKGGKRLPPKHSYAEENTGYLYIMAGNLKDGTVKHKQTYINKETFDILSNYKVVGGEVYITIVGACIGDAGIIPKNIGNAILTENAAKIIELNSIDNKYLALWLNSIDCQTEIKNNILSATLGKLALSRISTLSVPLPPTTVEQTQIVQEIERRLSVCDKMEQSIKESLEKAEALRQSILKKAFEGKLLTEAEIQQCKQEADYEPASELLKKIQAEKAVKGQATNKKKQKE